MSAYELIRLLAKMPPDARVYVPGYESGVDDLTAVVLCGVDRDGVGRLSCEGEFEMSRDGDPGVILRGARHWHEDWSKG